MDDCPAMEVTNHEVKKEDENEETKKENDEIELMKNDPIKKYQFKYNESLCMTRKYLLTLQEV